MADAPVSQSISSSSFNDICVVNEGSECACCHNLKLEMEFVIQELSSAREIIRMLREDGNTELVHETVLQDDHQEDPYNPQSDSDGSAATQMLQKSNIQYNKGFKIPTIVNGKIGILMYG